nr:g4.1 [Tranosema rostrale ichnovirus]
MNQFNMCLCFCIFQTTYELLQSKLNQDLLTFTDAVVLWWCARFTFEESGIDSRRHQWNYSIYLSALELVKTGRLSVNCVETAASRSWLRPVKEQIVTDMIMQQRRPSSMSAIVYQHQYIGQIKTKDMVI